MPKIQKYAVRNWADYNKSLVKRGSLTLWIEEGLESWYATGEGSSRGRPKVYSDIAIRSILMIKELFCLDFRKTEGVMASLFKLMGTDLKVPSYTQMCRRRTEEVLPKLKSFNESIHIVVDSSGLKVYGEGEWKVRQYGYTKRRTWRKLHIGVDEYTQAIVCAEMTKNDCGDNEILPELLSQYEGDIFQVSADGAYDSHDCHDLIALRGAFAGIPPQQNPMHRRKRKTKLMRPRDFTVWDVQQLGLKRWKKEFGYHRRSLAETAFSRLKRIFGDKSSAHKFEYGKIEGLLRCHMLNKMTELGMPTTQAV